MYWLSWLASADSSDTNFVVAHFSFAYIAYFFGGAFLVNAAPIS